MTAARLVRGPVPRIAAGCLLGACAPPALAHMMQVAYNLPVPLWMYAYGATAALIASFVVVAYFVKADAGVPRAHAAGPSGGAVARLAGRPAVLGTLRAASVAALALSIASGLVGTRSPDANINMTLFWVVFVLGFTYVTAVVGDVYAHVNPWLVVFQWLERALPRLFRARLRYPPSLAYWPALALYMAFIWLELFGHMTPRRLSIALLAYSGLSFVLASTFGIAVWARYLEFFAVFLRMVAKLAPVDVLPADDARAGLRYRLRLPFSAIWNERPEHFSLLLFVLFMLSSTAFDGVHETLPWVTLFWKHVYPFLATFIATGNARQYLVLVDAYYYWQWATLLLSPFVYLAIYLFFIAIARRVTGTALSTRDVATTFAYSLIPIAFVYHVTHYFTLLLSQGPGTVSLLSDPFGFGWNLLHTRGLFTGGVLLDAGVIWHTQVWLILIGHIVSVYVSHIQALRAFQSSRQATLSQAPILLLMVALTTIGLWILSMPIAAGQVYQPPPAPG